MLSQNAAFWRHMKSNLGKRNALQKKDAAD